MPKICFLFCLLLPQFAHTQSLDRYTGDLRVDLEKRQISVTWEIQFSDLAAADTLHFYVQEAAFDFSLQSGQKDVPFEITEQKFIGEDKSIFIPTADLSDRKFTLSYQNSLDSIRNPNFKFRPNWTELNIYTAWFPLNIDYGLFTYELDVKTAGTVAGSGVLQAKNDTFSLVQNIPVFDIPLIIFKNKNSVTTADGSVEICYTDLSPAVRDTIKTTAEKYFNDYSEMFGSPDTGKLVLAVNTFDRNISFARKGFISLSLDSIFTPQKAETLAHEIAHLWWNAAEVGTWEDWLNEGSAEYASMLILREEQGEESYENAVKNLEKRSEGLPPIENIDKRNPQSNTVLTYKGALLLVRLEQKIGMEKMQSVLRKFYLAEEKTTAAFLRILENTAGEELSREFLVSLQE